MKKSNKKSKSSRSEAGLYLLKIGLEWYIGRINKSALERPGRVTVRGMCSIYIDKGFDQQNMKVSPPTFICLGVGVNMGPSDYHGISPSFYKPVTPEELGMNLFSQVVNSYMQASQFINVDRGEPLVASPDSGLTIAKMEDIKKYAEKENGS